MGTMARNGERRERKMRLRSQTTCERADNTAEKAVVTNGNTEDIGGEVCPRGGVTLTAAVEAEVCAMAGETRLASDQGSLVTVTLTIRLLPPFHTLRVNAYKLA